MPAGEINATSNPAGYFILNYDRTVERFSPEIEDTTNENGIVALSLSKRRRLTVICSSIAGRGEPLVYRTLRAAGFSNVSYVEPSRSFNEMKFNAIPDEIRAPYEISPFKKLLDQPIEKRPDLVIVSGTDGQIIVLVHISDWVYGSLSSSQQMAQVADFVISKRRITKSNVPSNPMTNILTPDHYVLATIASTDSIAAVARNARIKVSNTNSAGKTTSKVSPIEYIRAQQAAKKAVPTGSTGSPPALLKSLGASGKQFAKLKVITDLPPGVESLGVLIDSLGHERFVLGADLSQLVFFPNASREVNAAITALYLCEYAAEHAAQDPPSELLDLLSGFYMKNGYFGERHIEHCELGKNRQERVHGLFEAIRSSPPVELGGVVIRELHDFVAKKVFSISDRNMIAPISIGAENVLMLCGNHDKCNIRVVLTEDLAVPRLQVSIFGIESKPSGWNLDTGVLDQSLARVEKAIRARLSKQ